MSPHRAAGAMALAAGLLVGGGCTDQGGVDGIVGGPLPPGPTLPGASTTTGPPTSSPPTTSPTTAAVPPSLASTTSAPSTTTPAGGLRLGGDDLGVTRVGAPFRDGVAAVTAQLGPPTGDPAPDTSCIGAEDETAWPAFRLASSGGRVSGWLSTSTTLATPAGATVGTSVAALRQAYGASLQVRPPAPDAGTVFVVVSPTPAGAVAGTLTGPAEADRVTSLFSGTCEAA